MFYLVWKDLLLTKKVSIFILSLYAIFVSLLACKIPIFPEFLYGFCILIFVYITTIYANNYDAKNNSEVVLNSLPIERKEIVKGKYLSIMINIIICGLIIILSTNLFALGGLHFINRKAGFNDLVISFIITSIIFSIYYPFYFKLERSKMALLNMVLYFFIFFTPSVLSKISEKTLRNPPIKKLISLYEKNLILPLFIACTLIYYLSYQVSKKLYYKRDF